MPLAEGGESISGDLKIDLRRLKNHSKQIDFSVLRRSVRKIVAVGKWLVFSYLYDKCRWSALHRHLSSFFGESQPVALFFDNFLAVYNINAFLQSV